MASKTTNTKIFLSFMSMLLHLFLNILFYIIVIFVVLRLAAASYSFSYQIFGDERSEPFPGRTCKIEIKKGESSIQVAQKLERNRLVSNAYSFFIKAKLTGQKFMPGVYQLNTNMTYDEILTKITSLSSIKTQT